MHFVINMSIIIIRGMLTNSGGDLSHSGFAADAAIPRYDIVHIHPMAYWVANYR
jgi:hypothetical protein